MNVGFRIPTNINDAEATERPIDLRQYLNFVWRNWMFIAAVTAFILLIGAIYLMRATPLYTASTQVLLERHDRAPGLEAAGNDIRVEDPSFVDDQLAILQSDSLLQRVAIKELPAPMPKETEGLSQNKDDPPSDTAITDGINRLRGALAVSRSGYPQIRNISITWDDPVRAGELANAVADAYVVDQLDARLEAAKRASGWLSDRITELRQQLRESEDAVAKFRHEHGLARSGPTVALNEQQIAELNAKLIVARTDAAEKKARVDFI